MTTIAWDGKVLAADRLGHVAGLRRACSKIFDCGAYWYAGCGTRNEIQVIADWLRNGASRSDVPALEDGGGWGLAIEKSTAKCFHVCGKKPELLECVEPHQADGSGRDFALSAMAFGLGAVDAVKFSARFNVDTGDDVDSVEISAGGG